MPGIIQDSPNALVSMMKEMPWTKILAAMGNEGEKTMIDLIMDCGIFVPVVGGQGNYFQLSGEKCPSSGTSDTSN